MSESCADSWRNHDWRPDVDQSSWLWTGVWNTVCVGEGSMFWRLRELDATEVGTWLVCWGNRAEDSLEVETVTLTDELCDSLISLAFASIYITTCTEFTSVINLLKLCLYQTKDIFVN